MKSERTLGRRCTRYLRVLKNPITETRHVGNDIGSGTGAAMRNLRFRQLGAVISFDHGQTPAFDARNTVVAHADEQGELADLGTGWVPKPEHPGSVMILAQEQHDLKDESGLNLMLPLRVVWLDQKVAPTALDDFPQ